ncbi:Gfo/Idh/MocA family protein [Halobellus captivus]|uniref:Gfo/Idh/MocA family protein n=1 Tax=Halobellus captivus TaxID=2592614 RepID=UPI00119F6ED0|nr:Gfo/Idh/MocA family oxidoreductase [Halobellus captivus]
MSEMAPLSAGVIGAGSMGQNHARVYDELPVTTLTGVFDVDADRAASVAERYDTDAMDLEALLESVDIVSIAVPTAYHHETARTCIDHGVDVLVEKPFVSDPDAGRELADRAEKNGVTLQVGHIERFNPAVKVVRDLIDELDVISVSARRLGPPPKRTIEDTAVMDLMIHDVDIILDLVDGDLASCDAVGTAKGRYATGTLAFESGVVGHLTASRVTQEKVRELTISARECRVLVDYIDQTVEIHRSSTPEYLRTESDVHYRHESVVEQLTVEREEPLKNELRSFAEAAAAGAEPVVTASDGLTVLEVTRALDRAAAETESGTADDALAADGGHR